MSGDIGRVHHGAWFGRVSKAPTFPALPHTGKVRFEETGVHPRLALLAPEDAGLAQRLAPETVVRNPENGFRGLMEQLTGELGASTGQVSAMQFLVALAGLEAHYGAAAVQRAG